MAEQAEEHPTHLCVASCWRWLCHLPRCQPHCSACLHRQTYKSDSMLTSILAIMHCVAKATDVLDCLPQPLNMWQPQATLQSPRTASLDFCAPASSSLCNQSPHHICTRLSAQYACRSPTRCSRQCDAACIDMHQGTLTSPAAAAMPQSQTFELLKPGLYSQAPNKGIRSATKAVASEQLYVAPMILLTKTGRKHGALDMGPSWSATTRCVCP